MFNGNIQHYNEVWGIGIIRNYIFGGISGRVNAWHLEMRTTGLADMTYLKLEVRVAVGVGTIKNPQCCGPEC